jgi:hypothetical protein
MGPQNPYAPPGPPPPGGFGPPPGYGYGPPPGGGYDYEFDAAQNAVIGSAATWAKVLGVVLIVVGAAALLNCNIISFGLNLAVGIFFIGGGSSLSAVVNTQGNDIGNMMQALSKLGTAFKIRVIVTLVAVTLLVVVGGIVAAIALAAAAR